MSCTGLFKTGFYYKRLFKLTQKEKPYKLILEYVNSHRQLRYPYFNEPSTHENVLYLNSTYECENILSLLKEGDYCFKCKGDILKCHNPSVFNKVD